MTPLAGWENFYVILGSSAGALIGLQFVVITLISARPVGPGQAQAGAAFGTPTIVHFGSVLLISCIVCAPWSQASSAALLWGLVGLAGIVYEIIVIRLMRTQTSYEPVFEDWLFHALLPLAAYVALAVSSFAARSNVNRALFGVAAAALALLFTALHNAWDAVTYHVYIGRHKQ
jgi:hypothetical protein